LRLRSGSALPSAQAPETSLTLIAGDSHLDCRAAPTLRATTRCESPWPNRSRKTSRIFRIATLSPGISVPRSSAKDRHYPRLKDCQRVAGTTPRPSAITITGIGDHDPPESVITIDWIE